MYEFPNETVEDLVTAKAPTEFSIIAGCSLVLMSCLSIYVGALSSISSVQENKNKLRQAEFNSPIDAVIFTLHIIYSHVVIYIFFELFGMVFISFLLKLLFTIDGVIHLTCLLRPFVSKLVPENHRIRYYGVTNITAGIDGIITFGICSMIGCVYFWNDPWILNNIFGITLAIKRITSEHLNNVPIAYTLLGLLAIWDVVGVFMTNVMITIGNSIKLPNKLIFPRCIFCNSENGNKFEKLGLGDIVFPGYFIALLLRFDKSLNRGEKLYFHSGIVGYIVGFVVTYKMVFTFKHAQPALLYLVPASIGIPCLVAVIKGDIDALLAYRDY